MLARTSRLCPAGAMGISSARNIALATFCAATASSPGRTTANSSPPRRAMVSARLGGDEFAVVLPGDDAVAAQYQIADVMPERVVHVLEVVEVHQQNRDGGTVALGGCKRL